jgi:predicted pyridoxine 5'-phosphate oxidase superfamily flavin-nucleotide-binding protein
VSVVLTNEQIKIIEKNPCAISTITKDNKPYAIVVAYCKVKDNKILITDNYMKNTKNNILNNNYLSLVVWNKDWKSLKIQGTVKYKIDGKEYNYIKNIDENKNDPCKGVLIFNIKSINEF